MAGCPPCDGTFTCDVTVTGQPTQSSPVTLTTKNGACVYSAQSGDIVFACGGALTSSGQSVGTWANCVKTTTGGPPTNPDDGLIATRARYGASSARTSSGMSPAARPRANSSSSACRTSAGASSVSALAYIVR